MYVLRCALFDRVAQAIRVQKRLITPSRFAHSAAGSYRLGSVETERKFTDG